MGSSLRARAQRRAGVVWQPFIRDALAAGNHHRALILALATLQSELAKARRSGRRRPGDAALIDAQLAGSVSAIAAGLHAHKPDRPAGCPMVPGPEHLLAAYEAAFRAAEGEPQ